MRLNPNIREMLTETTLSKKDLIYPLFITHGSGVKNPIESMPEVYQLSIDEALKECEVLQKLCAQRREKGRAVSGKYDGSRKGVYRPARHHGQRHGKQARNLLRFGVSDKQSAQQSRQKTVGGKFQRHGYQPVGKGRSAAR